MGKSENRGMRRRVREWTLPVVVAVACILPAGCDLGSGPSDVIDRETFIAVWIDLRRAALEETDAALGDDARTEVLERHGVTEDDLLDFADAHGRDVDFLRTLWGEVEARMDSLSAAEGGVDPDSLGDGTNDGGDRPPPASGRRPGPGA